MAQKNYKAYALTPAGIAARARAHARYTQKRREKNLTMSKPIYQALAQALSKWRTI